MTASEIVRVVLIIGLVIFLIVWRSGVKDQLKESREKRRKEDEEKRQAQVRATVRDKAKQKEQAKIRRTSQILKLNLEGLEQKSADVAGTKVWYLEGGLTSRAGTALLLHGFAGQKEDWNAFARPLLTEGLHVVAPDLPGFGQNEKKAELSFEVTTQAKRLRALTKTLALGRCHLVGSSLGGSIATAYTYAAADQVASLTLIEPFGVRVPYESELDQYLSRGINPLVPATPEAYDNLLGFLYERLPTMPEPVKAHRAREAAEHRDFYLKMWPQIRGGERAYLLDLLLPEIKTHLLVLQGQKSKVVHPATAEMIKNMVRGSIAVTLPECGHLPAAEEPEQTARYFLSFLQKLSAPQPG